MGKVEGAIPAQHPVSLEDHRSQGNNSLGKVLVAAGGPGHRDARGVQRLAHSRDGHSLLFPQGAQLPHPDPSFLIILITITHADA